jgi:hypothetical protein
MLLLRESKSIVSAVRAVGEKERERETIEATVQPLIDKLQRAQIEFKPNLINIQTNSQGYQHKTASE